MNTPTKISIPNNKNYQRDKIKKLIDIYQKSHSLSYMIFEYLFRMDPKLAWKHFDSSKSAKMIDFELYKRRFGR